MFPVKEKIQGVCVWQPTPVFFPGEFHGQRSFGRLHSMGCKQSDMTKQLTPYVAPWASQVAKWVKNLPAMQVTRVRSLGGEAPLEESMATHSCIPAWRIPMDRGAWWAAVHVVAKSLDITEATDQAHTWLHS